MVTMRDIAEKAGVSRATVSLVLNGKDAAVGIAADTRRRVREVAAELGYRPNQIARAMVTKRNQVLVYLVPDPTAEVSARIMGGVLREADAAGYFVKVLPYSAPLNQRVIEQCVELRPTGVVSLYVYGDALALLREELTRYRIPAAVVDSSLPMEGGIRVFSDDTDGMRQIFAHLTELGHRRIAFVAGTEVSGAARLRETAYREWAATSDAPPPAAYFRRGEYRVATIEAVTRELLALPEGRPTAIAGVDDRTALVVARVIWEAGLRVPEDVSVTGFADLFMADYGHPPLTTVAQPFEEIGRRAVRHLLAADPSGGVNATTVEDPVPTRLRVRRSTGPAA
jgi:LacI family transcriptional regulator